MKILHIGLLSHFTEGMLYQDNILASINAQDGHDVTYISDNHAYIDGVLREVDECDKIISDGIRLIRIKYDYIINSFISEKVQKVKKLVAYINSIAPDTILYHGIGGYELIDVSEYVKDKGILFYIDSHANFKNTARTLVSRLAYKYIHGYFLNRALPYARKILYIGYPEMDFIKEMYHIDDDKLELFPLGGIILSENDQAGKRQEICEKMHFSSDVIICSHSGKLSKGKKTIEILNAFKNVTDNRLRLLIYGSIPEDIKKDLVGLINSDSRVFFLGWKDEKEQEKILGATDLYIQPGTYSASAQAAMCDGCAIILNNDYKRMMNDSAFYEENSEGIQKVLELITTNDDVLFQMKKKSYDFAKKHLDYHRLSQRYLI